MTDTRTYGGIVFNADLVAVGSAQYYGVVGNGKIDILRVCSGAAGQEFVSVSEHFVNDGIYDVAWSEEHQNILAGACADGSVKVVDLNQSGMPPVVSIKCHQAECNGVDWNINVKDMICTAGWDHRITVCDIMRGVVVSEYNQHQAVAYACRWSPSQGAVLASVGGDGKLCIVDVREQPSACPVSISAHAHEVLSVDWNKYERNTVITGSVDKTLRIWDIRKPAAPTKQLFGHSLAVRRVKSHPFSAHIVASCSYDMSVSRLFCNYKLKP